MRSVRLALYHRSIRRGPSRHDLVKTGISPLIASYSLFPFPAAHHQTSQQSLERDPESCRLSDKIMLRNQRDESTMRFYLIASCSKPARAVAPPTTAASGIVPVTRSLQCVANDRFKGNSIDEMSTGRFSAARHRAIAKDWALRRGAEPDSSPGQKQLACSWCDGLRS